MFETILKIFFFFNDFKNETKLFKFFLSFKEIERVNLIDFEIDLEFFFSFFAYILEYIYVREYSLRDRTFFFRVYFFINTIFSKTP